MCHITSVSPFTILLTMGVVYRLRNDTYVFSFLNTDKLLNEPHYEKTCLCHMRTTKVQISQANNKGADQSAHPRSLISIFVVRSLDSIIPILDKSNISRL